jgi:hypothetical protein
VSNKILHIFDEAIEVQTTSTTSEISVIDTDPRVIYIYDKGKKGDVGPQGPPGFSGAGEPFFVITSGSLYATTASIAILANISSSLLPEFNNNFDIGSENQPWRNVYAKTFNVGSTQIISQVAPNQQKFLIVSASITASAVNDYGVFMTGNLSYLPPPVEGGIIKSGSDFFVGI